MRKIVLALLVLLLAVPAMATVEVRCAQVSDTNQVIVTYDVDDGNDFRAFGIKISVDSGASISGIDVNDADYWVFPGSIDINEAGGVNDVGSAIAAQDSNSFILEMGSLYKVGSDEDHNTVPPTSGQLCSFIVSGDCNVAIANDAPRGGVVMEDIDKTFAPGYVTLVGCQVTIIECYAGQSDYATWVTLGKPPCWCYPRQCHGDADGATEAIGHGTFWVGFVDLDIFVDAWQDQNSDWCADFDHTTEAIGHGTFRVGFNDLDIFVANWQDQLGSDPNCLD